MLIYIHNCTATFSCCTIHFNVLYKAMFITLITQGFNETSKQLNFMHTAGQYTNFGDDTSITVQITIIAFE